MKPAAETAGWSRRYTTALRKHIGHDGGVNPGTALRLGRQALALGLEPLDLAKMHAQALERVVAPSGPSRPGRHAIARAQGFFIETIVPIEGTHQAARKDDLRVGHLTRTLHRRTAELSASTRRLKQSVVQRQAAEQALKQSGSRHVRLAFELRSLQRRLRRLTCGMLSAQEHARQRTSRGLDNEIAQTLIAIDLGLLALKNAADASTEGLKKGIANTQQLVRRSTTMMSELVGEDAHDAKK